MIRPTANAKVEEAPAKPEDQPRKKVENRPKKIIPAPQAPQEVSTKPQDVPRSKVIPVVAPPAKAAAPPPQPAPAPEAKSTPEVNKTPPVVAKPDAPKAATVKQTVIEKPATPKDKAPVAPPKPIPASPPEKATAAVTAPTAPPVSSAPPAATAPAAPQAQKSSSRRGFWMAWAAVCLLLIGGTFYLIFFTDFFQGLGGDPIASVEAPSASMAATDTESETSEKPVADETETESESAVESTPENALPSDEVPVGEMEKEAEPAPSTEEVVEATAPTINDAPAAATSLAGNWIVSLAAVGSESNAQAQVDKLKGAGLNKANFFFLPDLIAGSKSLYKIYLGPYPDKESATLALDQAKASHPGAYCQRLPRQ